MKNQVLLLNEIRDQLKQALDKLDSFNPSYGTINISNNDLLGVITNTLPRQFNFQYNGLNSLKTDDKEVLNGWYIDDRFPKFMAYWKEGKIHYGIDSLGQWFYHEPDKVYLGAYVQHQTKPSNEVVEERLRESALRIGFKTGIVIEGSRLLNDYVEWHTKHEALTMFGVIIMRKGIWVEINPSIPQQKLQQLLEDAEFYGNVDFDTLEKLNAIKNTL